jgi:hypothetical protein
MSNSGIRCLVICVLLASMATTPMYPQQDITESPPASENQTPPSFEELQRAWLERLASTSKLVEGLSAELASAKSEMDVLESQVSTLSSENAQLKARLAKIDKENITVISYQDRWRTDTVLNFWFKTNTRGRLAGRLRGEGSILPIKTEKTESGLDHYFSFPGLTPGKEYVLEVTALDAAGADTKVKVGPSQYADLRASTLTQVTTPAAVLGPFNPKDTTPTSIRLSYTLSERAVVVIDCQRVLEPAITTVPCTKQSLGTYEVDKLGRVKGEFREKGGGTVVYDGLEPDTPYIFKITAYNEYAKASPDLSSLTPYRTAKVPPMLEFNGPISLEMRPEKVIASWRPTTAPKDAEFALTLATGEKVTAPAKYNAKDGKVTAELAVGPLVKALGEIKPDSATLVPTLQAVMYADDGRRLARDFQITVGVPKELAKKSNLTKEQKEAFGSLGEALKNNKDKKLSWKNIVELGLPVVLSFF